MKTVIKQILKAFCYLMLFIISQSMVSIAFEFVYGFKVGMEAAVTGEMPDEQLLLEGVLEFIGKYTNWILIISGIFTIFCLWIFFLIRKKKLHIEAGIVKFDKKNVVPILVMGAATAFFVTCVLSLLPISEDMIESYFESYEVLTAGNMIIQLIASLLAAPIVEEIIFRGLILSRLKKAMPVWLAVLLSSAVFGIVHGQLLWMAYTFFLGILLCIVAEKTKSISASILLHMAFNLAGSFELGFITQAWQAVIISLISGGIMIVMLYLLLKRDKKPIVEITM